jgi:hypothetical protein
MLWRRAFALSLALLALAAPASSFAQSAGQDQYQDPLAGSGASGSAGGGGSSGSGSTNGSGSTGGGGSAGTVPASTPSTAPTSPETTASGTTTSPTASGAQASGELPRTGFDVIVTFELGLAMLLLGLVSHRLIVLRDRRHS